MSAKTFDDAVNGAWRGFRESMAQQLEALPEGEFWRVEVIGEEPADGVLPYVQVMALSDGSFWAEATSNHYLAGEARLRRPQQRALREMGWGPVARAVDGEPPAERDNYWLESSDAEWVAVLTMRALREVYGVVDPAFVEFAGWGQHAHVEGDEDDDPVAQTRQRLQVVLDELMGGHADPDADGDFVIRISEQQLVFVRADADMVHVFAQLQVPDSPGRSALAQATAELNRLFWGPTFSVGSDSVVVVSVTLEADPVVAEHVHRCVDRFCRAVPGWAGEVARLAQEHVGAVQPAPADEDMEAIVADGAAGAVDSEDYMTAVIALSEVLEVGDLDSSRVAALFDWSVDRLRVALSELVFAEEPDARLREHLRRGMRRALRRSVAQASTSSKPHGRVSRR